MGYNIPGVGTDPTAEGSLTNFRYIGIVRLVNTTMTITLPAAANQLGRIYFFKKTDSNATTVTIDGYGSETIDGQSSIDLVDQYETLRVYCDGSNWHII